MRAKELNLKEYKKYHANYTGKLYTYHSHKEGVFIQSIYFFRSGELYKVKKYSEEGEKLMVTLFSEKKVYSEKAWHHGRLVLESFFKEGLIKEKKEYWLEGSVYRISLYYQGVITYRETRDPYNRTVTKEDFDHGDLVVKKGGNFSTTIDSD